MTVPDNSMLLELLNKIHEQGQTNMNILTEQRIKMAAVEEHLKNLNSKVANHEKKLSDSDSVHNQVHDELNKLKIESAKSSAIGGAVGTILTAIIGVIAYFLK